jgi:hypothetical protein
MLLATTLRGSATVRKLAFYRLGRAPLHGLRGESIVRNGHVKIRPGSPAAPSAKSPL